jgi:hypothetical protein
MGPVSRYGVILLRPYTLLEEWKMNKYLIEVSQGSYKISNMRASYIFKRSGSHFVTHAEWGYLDGKYKAWLVAETEDEKEAMRILPSAYRHSAKIVLLNKFSKD